RARASRDYEGRDYGWHSSTLAIVSIHPGRVAGENLLTKGSRSLDSGWLFRPVAAVDSRHRGRVRKRPAEPVRPRLTRGGAPARRERAAAGTAHACSAYAGDRCFEQTGTRLALQLSSLGS